MATKGSINGGVWVWNGNDSPGMIAVVRTSNIRGGASFGKRLFKR